MVNLNAVKRAVYRGDHVVVWVFANQAAPDGGNIRTLMPDFLGQRIHNRYGETLRFQVNLSENGKFLSNLSNREFIKRLGLNDLETPCLVSVKNRQVEIIPATEIDAKLPPPVQDGDDYVFKED